MSNMSYCRFRNTYRDLQDCQEALEDLFNGDGKLSRDELHAAKRLVELCDDIVTLIRDDQNLDDDESLERMRIEQALDAANEAAEESDD